MGLYGMGATRESGMGSHYLQIYCKFGNFHEGFIFPKLRICEVS